MTKMKILFTSSEAHPIMKTGGLADVSGALPTAIKQQQHDIRLVVPAYTNAKDHLENLELVDELELMGATKPIRIMAGQLKNNSLTVYLIDYPDYFERAGGPYSDENGKEWPDNAQRFTLFSRAVAVIALSLTKLDWKPDLVHCNDWQTGLVAALLSLQTKRPATLFTIHNLAYQGLFNRSTFDELQLPKPFWSTDGIEFFDKMSCLKAGLVYADKLSTVSPTYKKQICTEEYGCGLSGVLNKRAADLHGILNGIDYSIWNPGNDPLIVKHYSTSNVTLNKRDNKKELLKSFQLKAGVNTPVIGMITRLVEQKGIDVLLESMQELMTLNLQIVLLGSGHHQLESSLTKLAAQYPDKLAIKIGYDEKLAHLIEAGADMFLMPSRFEPCGLNQMYSLRYGTIPIVRKTGGLADTVINVNEKRLANNTATGFAFKHPSKKSLIKTIKRSLNLYHNRSEWRKLMRRAMSIDNSWGQRAQQYIDLYELTIKQHNFKQSD